MMKEVLQVLPTHPASMMMLGVLCLNGYQLRFTYLHRSCTLPVPVPVPCLNRLVPGSLSVHVSCHEFLPAKYLESTRRLNHHLAPISKHEVASRCPSLPFALPCPGPGP